jgi:hypothetical protein
MRFLVEDFEAGVRLAVLDEEVDGQRDALDRVLQVRVRHGRVVDVDGGAGADSMNQFRPRFTRNFYCRG